MAIVGLGVDAIEVARVRRAVTRTPNLLSRLWTPAELATCSRANGTWRYGSLAARFCAKEAAAKALGTGIFGFGFADVEVTRARSGQPGIRLHGGALRHAERLGVTSWHLSITHDRSLAVASVVAER